MGISPFFLLQFSLYNPLLMPMSNPLYASHTYAALLEQAKALQQSDIAELFTIEPKRANLFSIEAAGLFLDYSKHLLSEDAKQTLLDLADHAKLTLAIDQLFKGVRINSTEHRAALHTALRIPRGKTTYFEDNDDLLTQISTAQTNMAQLCQKIRDKAWLGFTNKAITHVVNIGIGGSDLGPKMAVNALSAHKTTDLDFYFVSTMDASQMVAILNKLNPETTLFIIASKTFSTPETLKNGQLAKAWLLEHGASTQTLPLHFIAITQHADRAMAFGIHPHHILPLWEWVGGRFSLWSPIGFSIALSIGMERFNELLAGAHAMDEHFRSQALEHNMPVILALLTFWYTEFFSAKTQAILPYDARLEYLVAYLQQLEMESNGKGTQHNNDTVRYATSPITWGGIGTNGQHAFHQLLHQGTHLNPIDLLAVINPDHPHPTQHQTLLSHFFAQSQALFSGCSEAQAIEQLLKKGYSAKEAARLAPHLMMPGNRPHSLILLPDLSPFHLGALIALYEHKVFVLGTLWNINSFDQWGVELGKELATQIEPLLTSSNQHHAPIALESALRFYRKNRK